MKHDNPWSPEKVSKKQRANKEQNKKLINKAFETVFPDYFKKFFKGWKNIGNSLINLKIYNGVTSN